MEAVEGIEPSLKGRELNSLRNLRDKLTQYAPSLSKAYKDRSVQAFYDIAQSTGFTPKEVPLNTSFVNAKGAKDQLTRQNPVRLGEGRTLYVGVENSNVVDFDELAHDVGACVLGGKIASSDKVGLIHAATLNEVTWRSIRKTYTYQELLDLGVIREGKQSDLRIATTYLLDAIVYRKTFPFRAIKYL